MCGPARLNQPDSLGAPRLRHLRNGSVGTLESPDLSAFLGERKLRSLETIR